MSFFGRLFGGKDKNKQKLTSDVSELGVKEEQKGIAYDPELVPKLKNDHDVLVRLYMSIKQASEAGEYVVIPPLLAEFKLAFQTHVMVENVKFYVYLQQNLANDPEIASFLSDIRKEMDGIARVLVKFVATYSSLQNFTDDKIEDFKNELAVIGNVLTKRVKLEESELYTLYLDQY